MNRIVVLAVKDRRMKAPLPLGAAFAGLLVFAGVAFAQTPPSPLSAKPRATAPTQPAPAAMRAPAASSGVRPTDRTNDGVVARLGDRDITAAEVRGFLSGLGDREQAALARDPALLSQTLRMLLANQLALKEALARKIPEQAGVAAQLQRMRDNAITEIYLRTVSTPPQGYPDDAELQKAYDANKSSFLVPRQFRLSQIFIGVPDGDGKSLEDKARKRLSDVQARLKQPKSDFASIAKEMSDQPDTAARGGDIGWVAEPQIRPEIKNQVMGLAKGAVGDPIKLDDGWHIIKLVDTKASETRPLSEVRELLVQRLRAQRTELNRRAYLARLLEQSPPAINELALTRLFDQTKNDLPLR